MGTNHMMTVGRRSSFLLTASLLGAVVLGSASWPPAGSGNVVRSLSAATGYFDSIVVLARNARPVGSKGDLLTVELGYLERLRIGLGSPFRLIDEAMRLAKGKKSTAAQLLKLKRTTLVAKLRRRQPAAALVSGRETPKTRIVQLSAGETVEKARERNVSVVYRRAQ